VKPEPKKEYAERDDMLQLKLVREQLPYQALLALMEEQNGRLRSDGHEELIEEEVVGARLYTGPMCAPGTVIGHSCAVRRPSPHTRDFLPSLAGTKSTT